MRIRALVGHGKMGQLVGRALAPAVRLRGRRRHRSAVAGARRRPDADALDGRRRRDRLLDAGRGRRRTCRRSRAAASTWCIGTTGWQQHEAALRAAIADGRHRHRRRAEFLDRRRAVRGDRRARGEAVRARRRTSAPGARGASRGEEGRAVGHGADAEARDGAGRLSRGRSTCRPRAPASFPARTRSASTARRKRLR